MNLLKDLIKNFRYKCVTSTDNEITVYLYYANNDSLSDSSVTPIESGYTDSDEKEGKIDTNKTLVRTENENEVRLNTMNDEITKYFENSKDINKITIKNLTKDHAFILESKVFIAATNSCNNIEIDMGSEGAGFRVDGSTYKEIDTVRIRESTVYLDTNCVLYITNFRANWMKVISYQYKDTPSTLHIFTTENINILNLNLYAPDKLVFEAQSITGEQSANTKLSVNYLDIFGKEYIESDKNDERILAKYFNKVYFDKIKIEDEVVYSKTIKVDLVEKFSINELNRNISTIIPIPMFDIGEVGKVNLRQMNITIASNATIDENNFAIVSFLPVDTELDRSIYFYTANIVNNNLDARLKILKLRKMDLNKVYLSDIALGNGVDLLDIDNKSTIAKLTFNNVNFTTTSDLTIKQCTKVSLVDLTINSSANMYIDSPYINITGGMITLNELNCNYDKEYLKLMFSETELHANKLLITNPDGNESRTVYMNDCKFDIQKELNIKNMNPAILNSYIKTEKIVFNTDGNIKLNAPLLSPQSNKKLNIEFNSNFAGSMTIDDVENTKLNIVSDITESENDKVNNMEIYLDNEKTDINWKTNRGFNCIIDGLSENKPVHISAADDFSSSKNINVKFTYNDDGEYVNKVINDSEKKLSYTESIDDNNNYQIFKFTYNE